MPVRFDGGLIKTSDAADVVTVVCSDEVTGAERWRTSFAPVTWRDDAPEAGPYCINPAGGAARVVDGLLLVVTTCETCRGATAGFTNLHRVMEGGRVAWGHVVNPAGGDVTTTRTPLGLAVSAAWERGAIAPETRLVDVDTGRFAERVPPVPAPELPAPGALRILSPSLERDTKCGAISPDGSKIALVAWPGSGDTGLVVLGPDGEALLPRVALRAWSIGSVTFDRDGRRVLVTAGNAGRGMIASVDVALGAVVEVPVPAFVGAIAVAPDGIVATAESYNYALRITLRDPSTLAPLCFLGEMRELEDTVVEDLAFSPDGRWLASADDGSSSEDGVGRATGRGDVGLVVWDVASGTPIHRFAGTCYCTSVAFHPDGVRLASASAGGAEIREVLGGALVARVPARGVRAVAFTADGRHLLTGGDQEPILVWDARDGSAAGALPGPGRVMELRAPRSGNRALAVGWRQVAVLSWPAATPVSG